MSWSHTSLLCRPQPDIASATCKAAFAFHTVRTWPQGGHSARTWPRSRPSPAPEGMIMALMPVADALAAVLAGAEPLPEELVDLDQAFHRVLARDVAALRTQPPQAMSAMDGYAVRAADAAHLHARLKVVGEVAAGRPFGRVLQPGEAARIFTGGVIPDGADAVVIQEDTVTDGDQVTITEAAVKGRHIRP